MAADPDPADATGHPPIIGAGAAATLLHQIAEALTALGNYLAVANRIIEERPGLADSHLDEAVKKSLGQYERATEAVRRLRDLARRDSAGDDGR